MTVTVEELKPMNSDLVVKHYPIEESSTLYVEQDQSADNLPFEVLRVGNNVTDVQVGDIVVVPWVRCMPPFEVYMEDNLNKITITDESEVLGILEF